MAATASKSRKRFTVEDAAKAAAAAGLSESAMATLIGHMTSKEEDPDKDEEELDDSWVEPGATVVAGSTARGSDEDDHTKEEIRVLRAKVSAMEETISEVVLEGYRNMVRIECKGKQSAREWHNKMGPFKTDVTKMQHFMQLKQASYNMDVCFAIFDRPKEKVDAVKALLVKLGLDKPAYVAPPPMAGQNPKKSVPRSLYKIVMDQFDQNSAYQLPKGRGIKTFKCVPNANVPWFSMEWGGKTFLTGSYTDDNMTIGIEVLEEFALDNTVIKGIDIASSCKTDLKTMYRVTVNIMSKKMSMSRAPLFSELKTSRGLRK